MASGKPLPFVADSVRVLSMVTTPPEIGVGGGVGCGDGPTYDVTTTIGGDRVALAAALRWASRTERRVEGEVEWEARLSSQRKPG